MRRLLWTLFASAPLLSGQFHSLATTDDGAVLYFSSSLRMRGTNQPPWEKIFKIDASGVSLYAAREVVTTPLTLLTNQFALTGMRVSGDGRVQALITRANCAVAGSSCFVGQPKYRTEISGVPGRATLTYVGQASLSRNGRYVVTCCDGSLGSRVNLVDLETDASRELPLQVADVPAVSSAGVAVAAWSSGPLYVATIDGSREMATTYRPYQTAIDDRATFALYVASGRAPLVRVDLATGQETILYRGSGISIAGISGAGDVIAFVADWQLVVNGRPITRDPDGLTEAALSGDGRVAYAVTGSGRIVRIEVASGEETELVGRTPTVQVVTDVSAVPGSAYCVGGTGLDRAELFVDGQPVPRVSPWCVQIPWEMPTGTHVLSARGGESLFESASASFYVSSLALAQFAVASAIHGDWSAFVDELKPARPGEMLHLYMTGLGPVSPPIRTGEPGPSNPPARTVAAIACTVGRTPVETVFDGPAPGLIGYYQVSLQLPLDLRPTGATLVCSLEGQFGGASMWLPVQAAPARPEGFS